MAKHVDEFRDPSKPFSIACPICQWTEVPINPEVQKSPVQLAQTSLRRDGADGDWEYRILFYGHCVRHGEFSVAVSSYGTPNYHDFIAYEAEKKSLIKQICGRLTKLAEELSR